MNKENANKRYKNKKIVIIGIAVVLLISLVVVYVKKYEKLVNKSYVGTYQLHEVGGFYLGKGNNDNDKMEYVFQVEPIDGSKTLSDNVDVTEGVTIIESYTEGEKESILKIANKSIAKKSMDLFKNNLGKNDTVSVFAASYKNLSGKVNTKYEYEILINKSDIKDFDD
ncbi:hypothetical protein [Clostridium coskatii]|uniref:Uncharacterized protein n=1 Tax=Clostridium coskatii TaxID=1705578 RepID=A0A162LJ58_9CLOT|nr:hypothetical protein [Clostridium coskatii]OAA94126.1 hypothetical protein WX73_03696 [Clostridium coskatii]OBR96688.1 hypothetical protein CLCOS_08500 [Clostridium coskatii]